MFENAKKGLSKVYAAEIFTIVAAIISIAAVIIMFVMGKAVRSEATTINTADIISLVTMLVALVLAFVSFFLNLFGIIRASKDDESFKNALIMLIVGIIASIVASILSKNHANIAGYFNTINDISELFVMYYVVSGCVSIAQTKKLDKLAATGNRVKIYIIVIWVIGLVINFFKGSFEAKGAASAGGVIYIVLAIVGGVATLVSYIAYLVILRKTIDSI